MQTDTFEVLADQEGERLDKYLNIIYPDILLQEKERGQCVWKNIFRRPIHKILLFSLHS